MKDSSQFGNNGRDAPDSRDAELIALHAQLQSAEREMWENKVRRADLTARLQERDRWIREVRSSSAWKFVRPLLKLRRHFSRRGESAPGRSELAFAIDPPACAGNSSSAFKVEGWCFAHGGPEVVGVRAKVGRKSYFARYGIERKEVTQNGDYPGALYAGFSLTLPATPENRLRLEAISQGGSWQCFYEGPLSPPDKDDAGTAPNATDPRALRCSAHKLDKELDIYPDIQMENLSEVLAPLMTRQGKRAVSDVPRFSVITRVCHANPRWIAETGASLCRQSLADWEWILVATSEDTETKCSMLEPLAAAASPFIRLTSLGQTDGNDALNRAVHLATAEFVCILEEGDLLSPDALTAFAEILEEGHELVYADEDKFDEIHNEFIEPFFKPEWSPEYFRAVFYTGQLFCVRRDLLNRIRFDPRFADVQKFDFVLRASESGARIGHIPKILHHARKSFASSASPHSSMLQTRAVNAHLQRLGLSARAEPGNAWRRLQINPEPRKSFPKVSIIIPTKDSADLLERCLETLYDRTTYPAFEVLLVDNASSDRAALRTMSSYPARCIPFPDPFNYSRANNLGARAAEGEYLLFLNNDTEIISPRWLEHLLYYAEQPEIGAAGALLLHDNGGVQHAGVVLGMGGTADHAMRGFRAKSDGYAGSLSCAREVSAVTAACMMMRKSLFAQLGGFNEQFLTIYQDVDLCLRVRARGLRIIWTPRACLLHHESFSRQQSYDEVDRHLLLQHWQDTIDRGDPYYNPNLDPERADYSVRG